MRAYGSVSRIALAVSLFAGLLFTSPAAASKMGDMGHEHEGMGHSMDHSKMGHEGKMEHKMASPEEMQKRMLRWIPVAESKLGNRINGELAIINQDGKRVKLKEYFDKPFFITFMFADCPHVCPTINTNLAKAVEAGKRKFGDKFRVLSISFDVDRDTVQRMREYGDAFTTDFGQWTFGLAEKDTLKELTEQFGFSYMPHPEEIWAHITMVSAVAKGGVLTKHFYGLNVGVDQFMDTLEALLEK